LHELQRRDDLTSGAWLTVTNNIIGTNVIVQLKDSFPAGQQRRFYRLHAMY
jgi:hypothetical protein